ncbi:MAG TPA: 2-hydroxyglutaryl-CoA dehydratase [Clostridium sp.]|jgi:predicted CoA-substrate-specific enzyme activase|uniref:Acyl-CoA dehydratase activase n=1 Tax=Clostridium lapidicellarium TaxID=3240931 RepID=A0ABV4DU52_9CLOT|nr:acyl-CoA dehydratase activase [uncultured Clostridium sp.]NLU07838.1 2-hydroxyglutaryl-CoA dehydratase [Clostridiales bacterium]HBC97797.1 2-hydroxyglutaryl-CoA dehydratase [Clostridium sp.]
MYTLGVDIGSTTSKCVILEDGKKVIASSIVTAGTGTNGPDKSRKEVLEKSGLKQDDLNYVVVTGYGRSTYTYADAEISELTCHALGVQHVFPDARTIIDIGGQDAKVLSLNEKGRMVNFLMNDKCAAGTGRFLDVMARILQLDIGDLEVKAAAAKHPVKISSTCTVFAESEVISQLAAGVELNDLVAGICSSVASRVASLAKRIGIREKVCMSGGVARNGGVRNAMSKELGVEIFYSPSAQLMGALGAALAAYNKVN